jgi:hypothetical protein
VYIRALCNPPVNAPENRHPSRTIAGSKPEASHRVCGSEPDRPTRTQARRTDKGLTIKVRKNADARRA